MKFRRTLICSSWIAPAVSLAIPAFAQSALYRIDGETAYKLVHKMTGRSAHIVNPSPSDSGGGNVAPRYRLQTVEEFFPAFVSVKVTQATFGRAGLNSTHRLDQVFTFTAKFSSDFDLADTFFVLAFKTKSLEGRYYAQEITPNELRQGKAISIETRLPADEAIDKYELHVFSHGVEVFNSTLPRETIESALGNMVAKRIKGAKTAAAKPLTGPMPRYPEQLAGSKLTGQAVVSCVIGLNGQPTDIKVKGASDPAFAEAATAAMSQWWFVPKIENGQPVLSAAELPFSFAPPK